MHRRHAPQPHRAPTNGTDRRPLSFEQPEAHIARCRYKAPCHRDQPRTTDASTRAISSAVDHKGDRRVYLTQLQEIHVRPRRWAFPKSY